MTEPIAAGVLASPNGPGVPQATPTHGLTFHEVLSALNPLQYLPVVGTIYRAVTGDVIPEPIRRLGSLIVSGLMGGPIGIVINIATIAAEKISGIDLDRTGQAMLHGESLGQAAAGHTAPEQPPAPALAKSAAPAPAAEPAQAPRAWSAAQLAAYGVQSGEAGMLTMADMRGADVLNALELRRLSSAHTAYVQTAALAR